MITSKVPSMELDLALQMFFKAINNSVCSNWLVITLLVFGAYPKMTKSDVPSVLNT